MSKSEIFNTILRMVSEETEIPSAQILSGRKDTETVDARYLLVHFLFQSVVYRCTNRKDGACRQPDSYQFRPAFQHTENIQNKLRKNQEEVRK